MKYLFVLAFQMMVVVASYAQQSGSFQITLSDDQYKELEKKVSDQIRSKQRSTDWAQFDRYSAMNDTLKVPVKSVFMGNSITESWGRIHPEFFRTNAIVNRAISGQTSSQMLVRFQSDVINLRPSVVIIMTGTNDIARNNGIISIGHILQNIRSMCELARYHGIKPVLCSVLPASSFRWNPDLKPAEDIRQLNELIKEYSRRSKIPYVDFYSVLVNDQGGLSEDIAPDGVHPLLKGYQRMEPVLLSVIRRYR